MMIAALLVYSKDCLKSGVAAYCNDRAMFNSLSKMRGKLQRSCGSQAKPCILLGSNRALSDFVLLMLLFADLQGAFKILCCLLKLIYAPTRTFC